MKWIFLLILLFLSGCATSRCSVSVYTVQDDVTVEARYEVGTMKASKP